MTLMSSGAIPASHTSRYTVIARISQVTRAIWVRQWGSLVVEREDPFTAPPVRCGARALSRGFGVS